MNLVEQATRPLGEDSKTISLSQGYVAIVDAANAYREAVAKYHGEYGRA